MQITSIFPVLEKLKTEAPARGESSDNGGAFAALLAAMSQPAVASTPLEVTGDPPAPVAESAPEVEGGTPEPDLPVASATPELAPPVAVPKEAAAMAATPMPMPPVQPATAQQTPVLVAMGPGTPLHPAPPAPRTITQADRQQLAPESSTPTVSSLVTTVTAATESPEETTAPVSNAIEAPEAMLPESERPKVMVTPLLKPEAPQAVTLPTATAPAQADVESMGTPDKLTPKPVAGAPPSATNTGTTPVGKPVPEATQRPEAPALPPPVSTPATPATPATAAVQATPLAVAETAPVVKVEPPRTAPPKTEGRRFAPATADTEAAPSDMPELSVETVERVMAKATVTRQALQEPVDWNPSADGETSVPDEQLLPEPQARTAALVNRQAAASYTVLPAPQAESSADAPLAAVPKLDAPEGAANVASPTQAAPAREIAGAPTVAPASPVPVEVPVAELNRFALRGVRQLLESGEQRMTLKIVPETLGELHLEVTRNGGDVQVKLTATTQAVRDLLESQTHHLREALVREGFDAPRIQISQQQPAGGNGASSWSASQHQQTPQHEQQQGGQHAWQGQRNAGAQSPMTPAHGRHPAQPQGGADGLNVMV